jgi:hypothetical protein
MPVALVRVLVVTVLANAPEQTWPVPHVYPSRGPRIEIWGSVEDAIGMVETAFAVAVGVGVGVGVGP